MRKSAFLFIVVGLIALSLLSPSPSSAVNSITGIALTAGSNCANGAVNITMAGDGTATREAGTASIGGVVFYSFEQPTGLASFVGTFNGYNYPFPDQAANSIITLYGYIGSTPQGNNTIEWYVTYNCTTGAVSASCYGMFPTCSGGATFSGPGLPADRNLVLITSDTAVYSEPGGKPTGETLKVCQTAFVLDTSDDGKYGRIYVMGGWIPLASTTDVPEAYGQPGYPVAPGCEGK
ncbi:MAG: hypothetical protein IT322_20905 [Anaerolineae bacterium]|nr:hypothetical protein [Anaerolineae bacterium]CAG1013382.1 hypothetical protein ANRL4_04919 [Anaerolineae bacterium]